jgi:TRAP-type C4-dicarboxylate transport system permease small subunit
MTSVTFAQVCSRYLLGFSIVWSEELCRYLFVWSIFIAVPSLLLHSSMTSFDMLFNKFAGGPAGRFMRIAIAVGEFIFLGLLYWGGYPFMMRQMGQVATSLPVSMALVYVSVPVSACIGMIVVIERALHAIFAKEASK